MCKPLFSQSLSFGLSGRHSPGSLLASERPLLPPAEFEAPRGKPSILLLHPKSSLHTRTGFPRGNKKRILWAKGFRETCTLDLSFVEL